MPDGVFGVATPGIVGNEVLESRDPPVRMTTGQIAQLSGYVLASQYASIQAAHDALPSAGGVIILLSNQTYVLTARLTISKRNVTLLGQGWSTILKRAQTTNQAVQITGAGSGIIGVTIDGDNVGGSFADIQLSGANTFAERIQCINPGGSIQLALSGSGARASNCTITGSGTSTQVYGIWAIGHVRVLIENCTVTNTGIDGIGVDGDGTEVIGCYIAGCHNYSGIGGGQLTVYSGYSVTLADNIIGQGGHSSSYGMELNGPANVTGGRIYNQQWLGIAINSNTTQPVSITGVAIYNSGQSHANGAAINIGANTGDVSVVACRMIDDQGSPTQQSGINIAAGTGDNFVITDCAFSGNVVAPIVDASTGKNKIIEDNRGIDTVIGTIASGATLTLPLNPVISLTGSATATVIAGSGCWTGRQGKFIPTGAVVFTAGATIGNTVTCVANVPIGFTFDGTKLYVG